MTVQEQNELEQNKQQSSVWPALSREQGLYLLAGLILLITRLAGLGRWALTERELNGAVSLLGWLRGDEPTGLVYSPLQWLLQLPLFALFAPSEWAARLPSALAGVVLIALIYRQRRLFGRDRALALAGLLIISPTMLHYGRQADGAFVAAAAALAATLLGQRALAGDERRDWRWFAVPVALGLASGAGFWTWVLAVGVVLLWRVARRKPPVDEEPEQPPESSSDARPWLLGAAVLLFVSTAGLLHLSGLGTVFTLARDWLTGQPAAEPWYWQLYSLALYEPLLLLLGAVGAVRAVRQGDGLGRFALCWLVVALWFGLFAHRSGYWLPDAVAPLLLLAATGVAPCWQALREGRGVYGTLAVVILLLLLVFGYLSLAMYVQSLEQVLSWLALGIALVVLALWVGLWLWEGRQTALTVGLALGLVLTGVVTLRSAVAVGYETARDPREPLVYDAVALDPRVWTADLAATSVHQAGDQRELIVLWAPDVDLEGRWYLRTLAEARPMTALDADSSMAQFVAADAQEQPPAGFVGRHWIYRLAGPDQELTPTQRLRWLLWREAVGSEQADYLALWYRYSR